MMNENKQKQINEYRKDKYQINEATEKCEIQKNLRKDLHNAEGNHYLDSVIESLSFELLENDPINTPGSAQVR